MVSSQFGAKLARAPSSRWCHQPWGGFASSWLARKTFNPEVRLPLRWPIIVPAYQDCSSSWGDNYGILSTLEKIHFLQARSINFSFKYFCYRASGNSCFRFLSCCQMMNCAIFGQKHADLKYVTDLLAFAHIAPPPLLSFSLSSHQLWHVNMISHFCSSSLWDLSEFTKSLKHCTLD